MSNRQQRPPEPNRRGRILETTLEVIAIYGVSGTTHRRIADTADIPLGSMTYYFSGIDEVVAEAFKLLANDVSSRYRTALEAAQSPEEACEAVVQLISGELWATRSMGLLFELYAYMARNTAMKALMSKWMAESREALERHFAPATARAIDAMVEGMTIHNFVHSQLLPANEVRSALEKLTR